MGRPANPNRKPELLTQIIEHVGTASLAQLTFRNLAAALGVSTYVLVYHFGSREELIDAILEESVRIGLERSRGGSLDSVSVDSIQQWLHERFAEALTPRHLAGIRLQFEAGSLELIDPDFGTRMVDAHRAWRELAQSWVRAQGVPDAEADILARYLNDAVYGLQFGFLLDRDEAATVRAFDLVAETFVARVRALTATDGASV